MPREGLLIVGLLIAGAAMLAACTDPYSPNYALLRCLRVSIAPLSAGPPLLRTRTCLLSAPLRLRAKPQLLWHLLRLHADP
jgi:hypothetical protein